MRGPDPNAGGGHATGAVGIAVPVALLVLVLSSTAWLPLVAPSAAGTSAAGTPLRPGTLTRADPSALRLLARAAAAPAVTPYRGVQFVSAWNRDASTSIVVRVDHRPGSGTSVRSVRTAQRPAVDTFLATGTAAPSILGAPRMLALLANTYDVTVTGAEQVAGRLTDVLAARRPGGGAMAARFWIDRDTALVLRREVYDERGRLTRASAFIEVQVDSASTGLAARTHPDPASQRATGAEVKAMPDAWPQGVAAAALTPMRKGGWTCPDSLSGSLQLVDARRVGRRGAMILHLTYSDGLESVSLFQQRGRLAVERLQGYRKTEALGGVIYVREGAPERVVWSSGGTVFTLVADAPARTVDDIVATLPRPTSEPGVLGRLGRGADRVATWFNPFQ